MQNFDYQRRTFMMFGRGRENEVGSLVKFEGGRRVLLHYDDDALRKSDLLDRIKRSLDRAGLEFTELGGAIASPTLETVYSGIDLCRKMQIDFVLAIGRSACVDSAKAICAGAFYTGDVWDFYSGLREPVRSLPLGVIVTCSDAGSECSSTSVILKKVNGFWRKFTKSSPAFLPRFAILNPELSLGISNESTAYGCMEMIAHVLECYFTNTKAVSLTDELCEGVLRTIIREMPQILDDPNDYEARANLMLAGTLAQNGMCGLGREADWSPHILELELGALYNTPHAAGLAVIIPAWLTYCLHHDVMRMAQFSHRVFGVAMNFDDPVSTAQRGIYEFRSFLHGLGLPQNFIEMDLTEVDIEGLVSGLNLGPNDKIGSYVKLDSVACEAIYTIAYTYRHSLTKPTTNIARRFSRMLINPNI